MEVRLHAEAHGRDEHDERPGYGSVSIRVFDLDARAMPPRITIRCGGDEYHMRADELLRAVQAAWQMVKPKEQL